MERLAEQVESLQRENRELLAENQRLISAQISEKYSGLCTAGSQNTQYLTTRILESHRNLTAQIESALRMIYDQVTSEGEATRERISSVRRKMEGEISGVQDSLNHVAQMQEEIQTEMKAGRSAASEELRDVKEHLERAVTTEANSSRMAMAQVKAQLDDRLTTVLQNQKNEKEAVTSSFEELKKEVSSQSRDIKEKLEQSLHQILEQQQQTARNSCDWIADANKSLVLRIEEYCTSALEEIRGIGDNYRRMEHDGQENLDKMQALSSEMLELGEHQKKVMEQLSQLCQDSDQFMEIQKSINDIWEIMKAVWVDSLLHDYEKELNKKPGN